MRSKYPDRLQVMDKRCRECLFSTRKLVSDARHDEILERCNKTGETFFCHEATEIGETVTCRGFFDANASLVVRLAKLLGVVEMVTLTGGHDHD